MNNTKINEQIIDGIREHCVNDKIMEKFLIELLFEEAEHPGQWWWKDTYKKNLEKYSAEWEVKNEN
jgi:hypothetical protein